MLKCFKYSSVLSLLLCVVSLLHSQPMQRIAHLKGSQKINGIDVSVKSSGLVAFLSKPTHCNGNTGPYYMGYNTTTYSCATGSYTFSFNPPVAFLNLNVSGLSSSDVYYEELILEVNGHHYSITPHGTQNECEPLAVFTPTGNIAGCEGCSGAGINGIKIEGPIYTLTVIDSVFKGEPAGVVFGLFMGYISLVEDISYKVNAYKIESSSGSSLIIQGDNVDVQLVSITGPSISEKFNHFSSDPYITVDITKYPKGVEYTLEMMVNDQLISKPLTIW